jgi:RimJ/RimL family protein N-acetyltransferase
MAHVACQGRSLGQNDNMSGWRLNQNQTIPSNYESSALGRVVVLARSVRGNTCHGLRPQPTRSCACRVAAGSCVGSPQAPTSDEKLNEAGSDGSPSLNVERSTLSAFEALERHQEQNGVLRGEHVILRPAKSGFTSEELRKRFDWSNDDELQYWSGSIPTAKTFVEFQRILPERDWPRDGRRRSYAILDRSAGLIGMVSCYAIDWQARTGELGVYIGERERWGHGLGTDAITTLVEHAFHDLGLRRIYLNTFATNSRALRSYSKVGFKRVTTRRRFRPLIGYYREVRMELERSDYVVRRRPGIVATGD